MVLNNKTTNEDTQGIETTSKAKVVSKLLKQVESNLSKEVKASLGDYIRLVQLQRELEEDEVREIKVTWVDPEAEMAEEQKTSPKESAPAKKVAAKRAPVRRKKDSAK
jgi:hypothetical protein